MINLFFRAFGFILLLVLSTIIPVGWMSGGMIASVHVHFILSYLYQARGGQINRVFAARFSSAALILVLSCWTFLRGSLLQGVASAWFLAHFYLDEIHLLPNNGKQIPIFVFLLIFWSHFPSLAILLGINLVSNQIFIIIGIFLAIFSFACLLNTHPSSSAVALYLLLFAITSFTLRAANWGPYVRNQVNFTALYHIYISYLFPYFQSSWPSLKKRRFFIESFLLNVGFITAGLINHYYYFPITRLFFSQDFFYFVTCLHLIATTRWIRQSKPWVAQIPGQLLSWTMSRRLS